MADQIALITGANAGIGYEAARRLLHSDANIGLICRTRAKAETARDRLAQARPSAQIECFAADVSSLDSIRQLAEELRHTYPTINTLINNAGAVFADRRFSSDGIELHLATNYLGHFLTPMIRGVRNRLPTNSL